MRRGPTSSQVSSRVLLAESCSHGIGQPMANSCAWEQGAPWPELVFSGEVTQKVGAGATFIISSVLVLHPGESVCSGPWRSTSRVASVEQRDTCTFSVLSLFV